MRRKHNVPHARGRAGIRSVLLIFTAAGGASQVALLVTVEPRNHVILQKLQPDLLRQIFHA